LIAGIGTKKTASKVAVLMSLKRLKHLRSQNLN